MKKILKTIIPVSLLLLGTIIPATVFALDIDTSYAPLTDIPGLKDATASNPGGMLKTIFNLSIGIGGILAVIMIIVAGFKYMYEESIFGKSKAKEQITNAFFGLLLILGSFIILKTINSDLLRINFLLPKGDGELAGLVADKNKQDASLALTIQQANKNYQEARVQEEQLRSEITKIEQEEKDLTAQIEALKKAGKSLQSPEALVITERLELLNARYEEKSDQADAVRKAAENERISTVKKVADQQIQDALVAGDTEKALSIAQKVASIEQTEIDRRKVSGETNTAALEIERTVTAEKNSVILKMGEFLTSTSNGQYPTRSETGPTNFFATRSSLLSQINTKYTELSSLDPVKASEYRLSALSELKKVDDQWSKNLGCSNGWQTQTTDGKITFSCKQ